MGRTSLNERAYLQERVLFFRFKPVGTEQLETANGLFRGQALVVALEKLEDIVDTDGLEVDLFLVIQVLGTKLDLGHIHFGVCRQRHDQHRRRHERSTRAEKHARVTSSSS